MRGIYGKWSWVHIFWVKYLNAESKERYLVNELETQLREKPLQGSQTQEINYSEDKASYKAIILT